MSLKKTPIFWGGFIVLSFITIAALFMQLTEIVLAGLTSIVWTVAVGLGANVGNNVQRALLYNEKLDKKAE
jgi:hypothetical protein